MEFEALNQILRNHKLWLGSEEGSGSRADLRGANLQGADLQRADLQRADLQRADLQGADLRGANLAGADLRGANLAGADLRKVNLRKVNLWGANLSRANFRGANLNKVDLWGANFRGANLSMADLSMADLSGVNLGFKIPIIPNIDQTILDVLEDPKNHLDMNHWHSDCGSTHCRAGWAIVLADKAGRELENQLGTDAAAALIYAASGSHPVPDWFGTEEEALDDMRERAA